MSLDAYENGRRNERLRQVNGGAYTKFDAVGSTETLAIDYAAHPWAKPIDELMAWAKVLKTQRRVVGKIRQNWRELNAIRGEQAKAFGAARGWTHIRRTYDGSSVGGSSCTRAGDEWFDRIGPSEWSYPDPMLFDHADFYSRGGRPVAIVSHLYSYWFAHGHFWDASNQETLAAERRCKLSWPDQPSWFWPSRTQLALIEFTATTTRP